jgi:hypothetical protein
MIKVKITGTTGIMDFKLTYKFNSQSDLDIYVADLERMGIIPNIEYLPNY